MGKKARGYEYLMDFFEIVLAIAIFILCVAAAFYLVVTSLKAEGYNLTQADIEEGRVLELCTAGIELEECWYIHGSIQPGARLK